jgi:hypothetical protein
MGMTFSRRSAIMAIAYRNQSKNSIDFGAKRHVWHRMIFQIIRAMFIAIIYIAAANLRR